jgi:hypothetical protein
MAGRVDGTLGHPRQILKVLKEAVIASEQVLRCSGRPAVGSIRGSPNVESVTIID